MIDSFFDNLTLIISALFLINRLKIFIVNKQNTNLFFKKLLPIMGGLLSFLIMLEPVHYQKMVFDLRSIPIFLVSYTVGWKGGLLSALIPASYRLYLGGDIVWQAIILSFILPVIISSSFRKNHNNKSLITTFDIKKVLKVYLLFQFTNSILQLLIIDIPFKFWIEINISITIFSILSLFIMILITKDFNNSILTTKKLEKKANHDSMTELLNFKSFKFKTEKIINQQSEKALVIIMLDIDHFKNYNDTNGHLAGNKVIKAVAKILKDNVREKDLVARYGGEEFIIAVPNALSQQEALMIARRIQNKITNYEFTGEQKQPKGRLTISIGISSLSNNKNLDELIAEADKQLYNSKAKGRNCITIK